MIRHFSEKHEVTVASLVRPDEEAREDGGIGTHCARFEIRPFEIRPIEIAGIGSGNASVIHLRPVDVVFSDGSKKPDETSEQFVLAKEAMPSRGYILYDDINFSPEIETLWRDLVRDPRVAAAAAFRGRWGLLALRPV